MKSVITVICLLIPLVILIIIVDRNDFYSGDDVTAQQETVTGKTTILTTFKPVEKPMETKPAETKPMEMKPVSGIKTAPIKPVETTPTVNTKPLPLPVAVPFVTAEDAEKLNAEALEYAVAEKEKREPFYRLYENSKLENNCFEGIVRATSAIPDPDKNDYDNCLYTLFVEIDSLFSEVVPDTKIAYEVIIAAPIMKDKVILQDNVFLPGDKIWCSCAEYDTMPQDIQEIQVSDDIQSYEHQQYYPLGIHKITAFWKGGNRSFAKREITVLPVQSLPKDEKAVTIRKERIQVEIGRIEEALKKHGGSFESWKEEYKPIIEKYKSLSAEKYKGWIKDSFFATGIGETTYNTQANIDGILPYKKYLEKSNIDLIVVRIPNKWEFARCVLASETFQDNPAWIKHYYECLKNDIEIVDPMPSMWEHRFDFPLFYFYNEPTESHPFEGQAFISAMVLSDVLRRYTFSKSEHPIELEDYVLKTSQTRYFWPEGNPKYNPKENIRFKRVIQDAKSLGNLSVNTGSPFVFLSNSMFWYPLRNEGASVPGYTAFFIQHIPDWFYQDGIGNAMLRNLVADHQVLSNRKAVIMVGKDWGAFPSFPRYLLDGAKTISLETTLDFLSSDIKNLDDGSFLFAKDEDGYTQFTQYTEKEKASKDFSVELSIPPIKNKSTCMLRVNFGTNSYITTVASDRKNKKQFDQTTLSIGTNQHADLYIPISSNQELSVLISFRPLYPDKQFSVKNIELWYY